MLGNVIAACAVCVVPVSSESLTQDGVQGLLYACRLDVPAGQVELGDGNKTLDWVVYGGQGKESVGVGHEVGDSLKHAARFQDEGREGYTREFGAGSQLADDVCEDVSLLRRNDGFVLVVFMPIYAAAGAAHALAVTVSENHRAAVT